MTELVSYALRDKIATLQLNNGKVNAFSPALIDQFNQCLDRAEQDQAVVVITGQPGMFSAGYDLSVMQGSADDMQALVTAGSKLARRLVAFPFPVIAACTGHAVAKGAFILLACDYRIGLQGGFKIGLNEVAIGMTMHHSGVELARGRLTAQYFTRSVICAEMYSPDAALEAGFFDQVVTEDAFIQTVRQVANHMSQLNMQAHAQTKLKSREQWLSKLDKALELDTSLRLF